MVPRWEDPFPTCRCQGSEGTIGRPKGTVHEVHPRCGDVATSERAIATIHPTECTATTHGRILTGRCGQ